MLHYQEHKRMLHVCWLLRLWRTINHVILTDVLLKSCAFAVHSYWKILVTFLPDIFVHIHQDTASITEDVSNDCSCGTGKTWGGYLCVNSSSSEMRNEVEESKCKLLQVRRMETRAAKYKGLQGCVFSLKSKWYPYPKAWRPELFTISSMTGVGALELTWKERTDSFELSSDLCMALMCPHIH